MIMALFVLCKLILQSRMCSHPVGLDVRFLVRPSFIYFHISCVRTAKVLARLRPGSPEPWLVAHVTQKSRELAQFRLIVIFYPLQLSFCTSGHVLPFDKSFLPKREYEIEKNNSRNQLRMQFSLYIWQHCTRIK